MLYLDIYNIYTIYSNRLRQYSIYNIYSIHLRQYSTSWSHCSSWWLVTSPQSAKHSQHRSPRPDCTATCDHDITICVIMMH